MLTVKQLWTYSSLYYGVLTNQQAMTRAYNHGSFYCISDHEKKVFFLSDRYSFGEDTIPLDFVTSTTIFPLKVEVNEECPEGEISTVDEYVQVFFKDFKQLTTVKELVNFVNDNYPPDYRPVKWNVGHFPIGTVCEAKVSYQEPISFTVQGVVQNGVNSYVLITDIPSEIESLQYTSINISWVTKIIKRGDGEIKIDVNSGGREDWFAKSQRRNQGSYGITKHKSQYLVIGDTRALVMHVVSKYVKPEMCLKTEALIEQLFKQGALQTSFVPGDYWCSTPYVKCSKQKLNKAVKRLLNKFLMPIKLAEAAEKAMYEEMHRDEEMCLDDPYFEQTDNEIERNSGGSTLSPDQGIDYSCNFADQPSDYPVDKTEPDNSHYPREEPIVDSYRASESE